MDHELLIHGMLFISLALVGIPGNITVISAYLSVLYHERRLLPADIIVLHLVLVNLLMVSVRPTFEALAAFQIVNIFNDAGCKGVTYIHRTSRTASIWLTFVLSAYQCLCIAPPGSRWATARENFAKFLWVIFLVVWIITLFMTVPALLFTETSRNDSKLLQNSVNMQFCFLNYPSAYAKDANGAAQTVKDVVPIILMTTASLIILAFLYKHRQQVKGLRSGTGGGKGTGGNLAEHRAAITVVTLVTLYVITYGVDNGLWIYTTVVRQTMSSSLISDVRNFFSTFFAAVSSIFIIVSNKKVKKHLSCGKEEKTISSS